MTVVLHHRRSVFNEHVGGVTTLPVFHIPSNRDRLTGEAQHSSIKLKHQQEVLFKGRFKGLRMSHFSRRNATAQIAVARRDVSCRHDRAPIKELGQPCTDRIHKDSVVGRGRNLCEVSRNYREVSQKESGRFDLPIALGILVASGQIRGDTLDQHEFAGELSLSGELRPVRGALAMALASLDSGRAFVLPRASAAEAALAPRAKLRPADTLLAVCAHLNGDTPLSAADAGTPRPPRRYPDLAEVKGQGPAKRALEVAAAGGHSLLMSGPPGSGKSMLASRLPGILPPLTEGEAVQSAAIHSVAGDFDPAAYGWRPYVAPHHSSSAPALVGGGCEQC